MSEPGREPEPEIDLDELAAWCRDRLAHAQLPDGHPLLEVGPKNLQRPPWRLTFNAACAALEALEARGDLERIGGVRRAELAWRPAPKGTTP